MPVEGAAMNFGCVFILSPCWFVTKASSLNLWIMLVMKAIRAQKSLQNLDMGI